jgi:hypothetical protein
MRICADEPDCPPIGPARPSREQARSIPVIPGRPTHAPTSAQTTVKRWKQCQHRSTQVTHGHRSAEARVAISPTRRLFPRLSGRRSLSARSASSGLLPRDQMRAWMSAAKCGRLCTGRCARLDGVIGVIALSPECQGLAGMLCLSLGSGSLASGIVGRVHRDDRRPGVETGAPQVAAPT